MAMSDDIVVILGIPVDNLSMPIAVERIMAMVEAFAGDGRARLVATVNVDFLVNTLAWVAGGARHPELLAILRRADMVTADGMPIVWASRLLGAPIRERVTGADLVPRLAESAAARGRSIYFLGGSGDAGARAANVLKARFPDLRVAGADAPFVHIAGEALAGAEDADREMVARINGSGADILLIGFGNPKQEVWFERNRHRLRVPVSIGVGGTYEFITGRVSRAPRWMQKAGLEWIYRITQDPMRLWKRYLIGFFKFGVIILPVVAYYRYRRWIVGPAGAPPSPEGAAAGGAATTLVRVVSVPGSLDAAAADGLRQQLAAEKAAALVLDFGGTRFVDSAGLGFLVSLWRKAAVGPAFFMAALQAPVQRFLKLSRTDDLFADHVTETVSDALERAAGAAAADNGFSCVVTHGQGRVLVRLAGSLDAGRMIDFDTGAVLSTISGQDCIVDAGTLRFLDSSGAAFLIRLHRQAAATGRRCVVAAAQGSVRQMLRITRLDRLLILVDTVADAERRLQQDQAPRRA